MKKFWLLLILTGGLLPAAASAEVSCALAATAVSSAAQIRQLKVLKDVPCKVQNKADVEKYLRQKIAEEYPVEKLRGEALAYKLLGIIPINFDYVNGIIKLYTDQLGGYYDPEHDYYVMAGWMPEMLQMPIAIHELTHALQDQHFNLDKLHDDVRDSSDLLLARAGLIEGDATAVMLDFARRSAGQRPLSTEDSVLPFMAQNLAGAALSPSLHEAPPALQSLLIFPYLSGLNFTHALLRRGGYKEVDRAFRSPPETTEQILHPEKYFERSSNDFVRLADPALPEEFAESKAKLAHTDELGEFGISTMLSTFISPAKASVAAAGWKGDRLALYQFESGEDLLVWNLAWDTTGDAEEFAAALREAYAQRFSAGGPATDQGFAFAGTPVGRVSVERTNDEVQVVIGPKELEGPPRN